MTPYEFLSTIWGGKSGYGFLCFKDKKSWKGGKSWKDYPIKLPLSEASIEQAMGNYPIEEYDWYFSPCTFSEPKRQARYAIDTNLLWADVDDGDVSILDKKPFLHWKTSKGRSSALWKQDQTVSAQIAQSTNAYIARKIGADKSGSDLSQVLRVLGTINHKPNKGNKITLISSSVEAYNFREEIIKGLFLLCKVPERVQKLLAKDLDSDSDRSDTIFSIAVNCFEGGMNRTQVFELLKYSKWNKFEGNFTRLKDDIERIWVKFNRSRAEKIDREEELDGLEAFDLSSVESEELEFLWDPYIPEGKITIIEGDPGLGKSWLTMKIAADLSCGRALPGCEPQEPRRILLLSAEDGLSDTIKPRLSLMQANFTNIFAVNKPIYITDTDMKKIRSICIEKNISVIVIDPLVAFMGGKIDLHKANQTRDIMARLARLGDELGITIICIRHLTKGGKDKAIYRGLGSIDITGAARSVLAIGRDPSNPYSGRVICHIKSNLTREGLSLKYYLEEGEEAFRWGDFTDDRAQDILAVDLQAHRTNSSNSSREDKVREVDDLVDGITSFTGPSKKWEEPQKPQKSKNTSDDYAKYARRARQILRNGGSQEDMDKMIKDAPEDIQARIRQRYYKF